MFYTLFNLNPDSAILSELDTGIIREVNKAYERLSGYTREEVIGRSAFDVRTWHDMGDRNIWLQNLKVLGEALLEAQFENREGVIRLGEIRSKVILLDDKKYVLSVVRDITDIKAVDEMRLQSEETLKSALMNMPVMLVAFNEKQELIVWNQECERVTGYNEAEMIGNTTAMSLLFPDPEFQHLIFQRISKYASSKMRRHTLEVLCKDGQTKHIAYRFNHLDNPVKGWLVWGIGIDITEQIKTEQALKASEQKFRYIARATNDALWDWDLLKSKIWWSESMTSLFGYTEADTGDEITWWEQHIYEPDRKRVVERIHEVIKQGNTFWTDEYRFIKKDGSIALVYDKGMLLKDNNGRPVRMVGGMLDITEMKIARERIIEQQNKLKEHSFTISHKIRASLARVMGLAKLYEYDLSPEDLTHVNAQLVACSKELDQITRDLSSRISEE